ncbi:gypsy retrotransposon integrase-like protein 1 [Stegostoma tigrinum]|uniref:gypsy retrotransposon integrase-like protein 1 n=1 Tax=Stegostoma tigrinum TaxID=3053191 RepID=UPI002870558E|nr:gypsy retrotransposon integrase-like protein 1 [Stegostoma tigrinum]
MCDGNRSVCTQTERYGGRYRYVYRYLSQGAYSWALGPLQRRSVRRLAANFRLEGGCLYYVGPKKDEKREVVADREKRRQIFLECHFSDIGCHLGQKKTAHRIQSRYYWLGIVKDVVDWIKMCETCQHAEHYKNVNRKLPLLKVTRPWEILVFDLIGPFPETTCGNTYVLMVTDYFTKWVEAIPIQKKDALSVAKGLAATFYRFGASRDIFSSESRVFCDEVNKNLFERWNISHKVTPAEHLQRAGLVDRTNEILKAAIRNTVNSKQTEWDDCLDPVLFEFRTSVNSSTKFTPFFLLYNREAQLSSEGKREISPEYRSPETCGIKTESLDEFTSSVSEQQNAVKEMVIANMAAAHKQEKKNEKRKARKGTGFTASKEVYPRNTNPTTKKHKKSHFVSFHIETTLSSEHRVNGGVS